MENVVVDMFVEKFDTLIKNGVVTEKNIHDILEAYLDGLHSLDIKEVEKLSAEDISDYREYNTGHFNNNQLFVTLEDFEDMCDKYYKCRKKLSRLGVYDV